MQRGLVLLQKFCEPGLLNGVGGKGGAAGVGKHAAVQEARQRFAIRAVQAVGGQQRHAVGAALTGSIAEAFYGVPEELRQECRKRLTPELAAILRRWESAFYNEKSVVEFEMENKIRRDFHGDFELFRCA